MITAPEDLAHLMHRRRWSRGEKRILMVLLSGSGILSEDRIERVARSRHSTMTMVLDLMMAHELAGRTSLGHYYLNNVGHAFCLHVVGLA